jgi:hypothetical protein
MLMSRAHSNLILSLAIAASAASIGCNGAISGLSQSTGGGNPGAAGSGAPSGAAGSNSGVAGSGTPGAAGTSGGGAAGASGSAGVTGAGGSVMLPGSALQSSPVLRLANYEFLNSIGDLLKINADVPLDPDAP